jgi:hypothetical protein
VVKPGQVIVSGDTTFRTRERNAIEVATVRRFNDRDATGLATLHGLTLDDAQRSPLVHVAAGRAWLSLHEAFASEPQLAYETAHRGIDELGTAYRDRPRDGHNLIDDTGQAIRLSELAANVGDLAAAAAEMGEVLKTRIELYVRAYRGTVE